MRYRAFAVRQDLLPLLTTTYLSQGEQLVVYGGSEQPFSSSFDAPGRAAVPKRSGEEGGKPRVKMVVSSPVPASAAVQIADFLGAEPGGYVLTDRRFVAFRLVSADPSIRKPSVVDELAGFGRILTGKEDFPVYPTACELVVEFPPHQVSYRGIHQEKPRNCRSGKYHRIAFADGSTLGVLDH